MDVTTPKTWRLVDALKWSRDYLSRKGVESAQLEAEWMLREVVQCSRLEIYLNHERPLTGAELARFKKLLQARAAGKPLQYVLGYAEFLGYKILVNEKVLIPRTETEVIVEKLLKLVRGMGNGPVRILDVGTGSGCIAIALAAGCSACRVVALDISQEALQLAHKSAVLNRVAERIGFIRHNILKESYNDEPFDVIVSNPPYVAGEWWQKLDSSVKTYEPEIALNPGRDALVFYRRLAQLGVSHLNPGGIIAVEIGGDYQEEDVSKILKESGFLGIQVVKDYLGQSRGIFARAGQC
jgi:release factor glutamine methyltransferase